LGKFVQDISSAYLSSPDTEEERKRQEADMRRRRRYGQEGEQDIAGQVEDGRIQEIYLRTARGGGGAGGDVVMWSKGAGRRNRGRE
jgi:hypothetical protein